MPKTLWLLTAVSLLLLLAACGDDDDDATPTLTPTQSGESPAETEEPTEQPDGEETEIPDDEKPSPTDDPGEGTPGPSAPGEVPTPPPTASEGTPAVRPADEAAFLASLGSDIQIEPCAYNPSTALTDCGTRGLYAIDPPIVGQDTQCDALLVAGTVRGIQCRSAEPLQTINYEVQA